MSQRFKVYGSLRDRQMTDAAGAVLALPTLYLGDSYSFVVPLLDDITGDGTLSDVTGQTNVLSLSASIGAVQAPAMGGDFTLKFGAAGAESDVMTSNEAASDLQSKLTALPECAAYGLEEIYQPAAGTWMLRFTYSDPIPLKLVANRLQPISFVRIEQFTQDGQTWVEVKTIQAPIASTAESDRLLADAPSVRRIRAGYTDITLLGTYIYNEIQALTVPPDFKGTLTLKQEGHESAILSAGSGIDDIAAALNALYTDGVARFSVTNPQTNQAYIEFIGPFSGLPKDLISVQVYDTPIGPLTFDLNLNTVEAAFALRDRDFIDLIFELWLNIAPSPNPDNLPGKRFILWRESVRIEKPMQFEGLAALAPVDWLLPPQPRDFIPFTRDQVITGQQQAFPATIGDGVHGSFDIIHNLNCQICEVTVVEVATGRRLKDDEYSVVFNSATHLTVSGFAENPTGDQYQVLIVAVGPPSVFQSHHHAIGQIDGLQAQIDDILSRLSALEDLLPHTTVTTPNVIAQQGEIDLPDVAEILPLSKPLDANKLKNFDDPTLVQAADIPRAGYLLPAVHDAVVADLPSPAPTPADAAGHVYNVVTPMTVFGGRGIRGRAVKAGDKIASDGRIFYKVNQTAEVGKNSYYPEAFDREFFLVGINDEFLKTGQKLSLTFELDLQLFNATSNVQYALVIEVGETPAQDAPAPVGINLEDVVWNDIPLLRQRIIVTRSRMLHRFGAEIIRSATNAMAANAIAYGAIAPAAVAPSSPNFVIRARLVDFDTENNVPDATGLVYYRFAKGTAGLS